MLLTQDSSGIPLLSAQLVRPAGRDSGADQQLESGQGSSQQGQFERRGSQGVGLMGGAHAQFILYYIHLIQGALY